MHPISNLCQTLLDHFKWTLFIETVYHSRSNTISPSKYFTKSLIKFTFEVAVYISFQQLEIIYAGVFLAA